LSRDQKKQPFYDHTLKSTQPVPETEPAYTKTKTGGRTMFPLC